MELTGESIKMQNDASEFERRFLSLIPPSYDPRVDVKYYPASVKLKNGNRLEKVIFIDRLSAKRAICSLDWLESHGTRLWDQVTSIDPSAVSEVSPSEYRLNPELVFEIHRLNDQRRYDRILITKDEHPIQLSISPGYMGLGLFDFPVLSSHGANDINKLVGYSFVKKLLKQQIKEDERQQRLPSSLLKKIKKGWKPDEEAKPPEPWEMCYCIYPSKKGGNDSDQRILERYGNKALKWYDVNDYNYHYFVESINAHINEERAKMMESSSLFHKNGSFFEKFRQGKGKPDEYEPKNIDDKLLQGLNQADEGRYLVKATLKDGTIVDNVILIHENKITIDNWNNPPYMSYAHCKSLIDVDDIQNIEPSPNVIPTEFRNKLPLESGMGSLIFAITMKDGSIHAYAYSRYGDFIDVSSPYSVKDIRLLEAWGGLIYWAYAFYEDPIFATCVFKSDRYPPSNNSCLQALRGAFKRNPQPFVGGNLS
jgi:hypothetical protein